MLEPTTSLAGSGTASNLASSMPASLARLEAAVQDGVLGGKAAGAGAGGAMFFVARDGAAAAVADAARGVGATVLPVRFATQGVRAW